jgi:hypothetical protein
VREKRALAHLKYEYGLGTTGKTLNMWLILATNVASISELHISKIKTNGKSCNSSMIGLISPSFFSLTLEK